MRPWFVSACLLTAACATPAVAQAPVAYVYVAEDTSSPAVTSPITAYTASSTGKLTPLGGSPFRQTSGTISGTNGSHFITVDQNGNSTHQYLHVYNVGTNGVLGSETAKQDLHEWCAMDGGAEFDHTGQFIYVADDPNCGRGYQSFALSKSGHLTFTGSLTVNYANPLGLPVFSGNDKFAYTWVPGESPQPACPISAFLGLGRETTGALQDISFTGNRSPWSRRIHRVPLFGYATPDPTNYLAALLQIRR